MTSTPPNALLIRLLPSADPIPPATAAVPVTTFPGRLLAIALPTDPLVLGEAIAGADPLVGAAVAGPLVAAGAATGVGAGAVDVVGFATLVRRIPTNSFKGLRVIS